MKRSAGILLHITSLPSKYGVGTLGEEAYRFADFLKECGQTYWQVLPIGPTGFGDSPYQPFSSFAGNPYMIDLDKLADAGMLQRSDYEHLDWGDNSQSVDYGKLYENRYPLLRKAYKNANQDILADFESFKKDADDWLGDYALYMSIKNKFDGRPMSEWPDEDIRLRKKSAMTKYKKELKEDIEFWSFVQYLFFRQWVELKKYVNSLGIKFIGDMPIYVSCDSSDVWAEPKNFLLDDEFNPTFVAGCPPDAFCEDGQLWGNPLYNWDYMKRSKYLWWKKRLSIAKELFDCIRIDHFRGFSSYFSIPADAKSAKDGEWEKGPGMSLFNSLNKAIPDLEIIAEDLGFIDDDVKKLLKDSTYPGMKILQFAFDSDTDNLYLPHNYINNCVVYTGNHDNDTSCGWFISMSDQTRELVRDYCSLNGEEGYVWGLIKTAYRSIADLAIVPMQDFLDLDSSARMNTPATVGNWTWRVDKGRLNNDLSSKIARITKIYGRKPKKEVRKEVNASK